MLQTKRTPTTEHAILPKNQFVIENDNGEKDIVDVYDDEKEVWTLPKLTLGDKVLPDVSDQPSGMTHRQKQLLSRQSSTNMTTAAAANATFRELGKRPPRRLDSLTSTKPLYNTSNNYF